jgi:hypothetical protein
MSSSPARNIKFADVALSLHCGLHEKWQKANFALLLFPDVHVFHGLALPEEARALPESEGAFCWRYVGHSIVTLDAFRRTHASLPGAPSCSPLLWIHTNDFSRSGYYA